MFAASISPAKQKFKNALLSLFCLMFFIVLLPFVLLTLLGMTLVTALAIKVKGDKIKRQRGTLFHAVKNKDYTVI